MNNIRIIHANKVIDNVNNMDETKNLERNLIIFDKMTEISKKEKHLSKYLGKSF